MEADSLPIALRRQPRSSIGPERLAEDAASCQTDAKTPRRKKRVRFSDPGPSASTGLTPFIRRTSMTTPKRRRASTPSKLPGNGANTPSRSSKLSHGEVTFSPLHQTTDGRVQRRIRRSGVRDMMNKLDQDKKRQVRLSHAEVRHLKDEVKARDREIYELQNATIVIDTERIWDLEQQVFDLKAKLAQRPDVSGDRYEVDQTRSYDWTMAARDPFADDYMDMTPDPDDEEFGNETVAQLACSTPSRARSSFPTPPATSPTAPMTPSSKPFLATPQSHVGVQVSFYEPEKRLLEDQLASVQLEVTKLTTTLDSYKALTRRVSQQLSSAVPLSNDNVMASSTDALERQVEILLQTMSDRTTALSFLTSSISDLGFQGKDASDMLTSLASGFRAARLELEYLTPGEISLPLTSHGAEVLDLLLTQLRNLAKKSKEDETSIDEYHEIELSLRKQLDARVSVMDGLKAEMSKAEQLFKEKNLKVQELQVGNERLKGAVDCYIRDISELEKLVERMEQEARDAEDTLHKRHEASQQLVAGKDTNIAELETKLSDAMQRTVFLQKEISDLQDSQTKHVVSLNKRHGNALALRDARVMELREEIDRVNDSLRSAHETIRQLRVENGGLSTKMTEEKSKAKAVIDSMKEELQRALQMSHEFLNSPRRVVRRGSDADRAGDGVPSSPLSSGSVVEKGGYLVGDLARRGSKKMRRRYDSGLGFLDEDEIDI